MAMYLAVAAGATRRQGSMLHSGTAGDVDARQGPARARERPSVDLVVPFFGPRESLKRLIRGLRGVELGPGDSLTVVDNRPPGAEPVAGAGSVSVARAPSRQSSYHARNVGAARGRAAWLLFVDADVVLRPDLLDRYFDRPPADSTGVIAGAIE